MSNLISSIVCGSSGTITTTGTMCNSYVYNASGFASSSGIKNSNFAKYNILGEEIEFPTLTQDLQVGINLSLINLLGKPFYDELKKNGVRFVTEIDQVLQEKLKISERDKKITSIINDK